MYGECLFCEESHELSLFITGQWLCPRCMKIRKAIRKRQDKEFQANLDRATATVKSWAPWKQNILGRAL